jgi:ubiquinone/menaquinone biosynthesis C-methylase UbiE
MLPRVLEPEAMDTPEEARDYDRMDHSEVNARFVVDFLRAHGPCRGGEVLDVGTGPARIPIALCRADPKARVLGVDLAGPMLDRARENVVAEGLSERIRLVEGDAKALELHGGGFEAVISNTIVHHIPEPAPALGEMVRLVAPGGTLLVRDLYRPEDAATLARLVTTYAGAEAPAARDLFEASLNAALTLAEVRALVRDLGLPDEGVTMTSDRHWTWVWNRPA